MRKVYAQRGQLKKKVVAIISLSVVMITPLLFSTMAFANEEGHHEKPGFSSTFPYWVNFTMYAVILLVVLKKPIAAAWSERTEGISSSVFKGRNEREQAEQALRTAKQKESRLQSDIEALNAQIKNETKAEAEEMLRDARERAVRILAQGKDMAAAEQKAFTALLRKELADEVMKRATEMLQKDLNSSTDAELRASGINNVGQLLN